MNTTDTPRTDAEADDARNVSLDYYCRKPSESDAPPLVVTADFARELERELSAERALADRLASAIKDVEPWSAPNSQLVEALAAWQSARTSQ